MQTANIPLSQLFQKSCSAVAYGQGAIIVSLWNLCTACLLSSNSSKRDPTFANRCYLCIPPNGSKCLACMSLRHADSSSFMSFLHMLWPSASGKHQFSAMACDPRGPCPRLSQNVPFQHFPRQPHVCLSTACNQQQRNNEGSTASQNSVDKTRCMHGQSAFLELLGKHLTSQLIGSYIVLFLFEIFSSWSVLLCFINVFLLPYICSIQPILLAKSVTVARFNKALLFPLPKIVEFKRGNFCLDSLRLVPLLPQNWRLSSLHFSFPWGF